MVCLLYLIIPNLLLLFYFGGGGGLWPQRRGSRFMIPQVTKVLHFIMETIICMKLVGMMN
jgi:hypothetical protein